MSAIKKTWFIAIFVLAIGVAVYETMRAARDEAALYAAEAHGGPGGGEVQRLRKERDLAATRAMVLAAENRQLRESAAELPKLRGEVTELRKTAMQTDAAPERQPMGDAFARSVIALTERAAELNDYLRQKRPGWCIPEFQFLTAEAWLAAARGVKLDSETSVEETAAKLRSEAKREFGKVLAQVLQKYVRANQGQLPADPAMLKPWFETPVDDAVFARYEMTESGSVADLPEKYPLVIQEKAPAENEPQLYAGPSRYAVYSGGPNQMQQNSR